MTGQKYSPGKPSNRPAGRPTGDRHLSDQKVPIVVPRVRDVEANEEVPLGYITARSKTETNLRRRPAHPMPRTRFCSPSVTNSLTRRQSSRNALRGIHRRDALCRGDGGTQCLSGLQKRRGQRTGVEGLLSRGGTPDRRRPDRPCWTVAQTGRGPPGVRSRYLPGRRPQGQTAAPAAPGIARGALPDVRLALATIQAAAEVTSLPYNVDLALAAFAAD